MSDSDSNSQRSMPLECPQADSQEHRHGDFYSVSDFSFIGFSLNSTNEFQIIDWTTNSVECPEWDCDTVVNFRLCLCEWFKELKAVCEVVRKCFLKKWLIQKFWPGGGGACL